MTKRLIKCHKEGVVATITLNNPPLNVFKIAMIGELDRVLNVLEEDDGTRAVILAGEGRAFCAGSDISEFCEFHGPGQVVEKKLRRQNAVFEKLASFPKPTVAAIQGLAFGGGLEIALCCDLLVAEVGCTFALPEMNLGVFPSSGGPYRIVTRIGEGRAKQLIFLTETIDADTALDWGLIDRLVSYDQLVPVASSLAANLAKRPRLAFAACKALIGNATRLSTPELIARSLDGSDRAFSSGDCREGVRAFFAKEVPDFQTGPSTGSM